jgi:hypothetical protein
MTSQALHPRHQRPRDVVAVVRRVLSWLLFAVLAVDLIGSPLHTHRHDGEWTAGGMLGVSSVQPDGLHSPHGVDAPMRVAQDDAPGFSHSISALRGHVEAVGDGPSSVEAAAAAPWFVPALRSSVGAAAAPWPPDRHRAGAGAFKSLPPHGRAPPLYA